MARMSVVIVLLLVLSAPLFAVGSSERRMAVTFDDLPSQRLREGNEVLADMTARLLAHIERRDMPAVGFVNEGKLYTHGRLDEERVELLRTWCEAGLELGNHTFSHPDLHRTPLAAFKRDIIKGERVTRPLLEEYGMTLRYFRHPQLHTGRDLEIKRAVEQFLAERGYRVAAVTIDNSEWIFAKAYDEARRKGDADTMKKLADAYLPYMEAKIQYFEQQSRSLFEREIPQVLLLHANHLNAEYFGALADMIQARGYRWVSLEEALSDKAYRSADTYTGPGGITWIHRWAITAGKGRAFFGSEPVTPQWVLRAAGIDDE